MKKLLIATHNPGKFKEYKILFKEIFNLPFNLISLNDLKIQRKVVEKGKNYEENAVLKAKFYSKLSKLPVLADDSGLEIEILDGWPGIKSRRKENGKSASDKELIEMVIKKMKGIPFKKRWAKYKTVIALIFPKRFPKREKIYTFKGERKGFISEKPALKIWKGFPYDSIFYLPEKKNVFVNLTQKEKAEFSHRKAALEKLCRVI